MRPMNTRIIQIIDNANEIFIVMSGYAIILFSNWIYNFSYNRETAHDVTVSDDPELRYNLGYWYLGFLSMISGINLFLIIYEICRGLRKKRMKKKYYKKWEEHYKKIILYRN
jgi:uncharacterized membrane protein